MITVPPVPVPVPVPVIPEADNSLLTMTYNKTFSLLCSSITLKTNTRPRI